MSREYTTKAKFEHALRMAELADIKEIGAIELAPDGTIRIERVKPVLISGSNVEDDIAGWRSKRGK